jgi:DNA helicase-2/ATP-dependent DNA helicase PcrA
LRQKYQDKWHYLHNDVYQDTNTTQYLFYKLLAEKHKNICVVGDVDQNIYFLRGANFKKMLKFEEDIKTNAKIILLEQNYSSNKNIIEAANEVIKKNKIRKKKILLQKMKKGK